MKLSPGLAGIEWFWSAFVHGTNKAQWTIWIIFGSIFNKRMILYSRMVLEFRTWVLRVLTMHCPQGKRLSLPSSLDPLGPAWKVVNHSLHQTSWLPSICICSVVFLVPPEGELFYPLPTQVLRINWIYNTQFLLFHLDLLLITCLPSIYTSLFVSAFILICDHNNNM